MSNELMELCQKYNLKLIDTNKVYWFLANNQEDEAIRCLMPLVEYDYIIAKKIVQLYAASEQEQIEDGRVRIQNGVKQEFEIRNTNIPKCPTCSSTNLKKISATSKVVNTAMFGIWGTKRYKQFHCNNCGYEW